MYEPDPRHAEIIISNLCLQEARAVSTPGVKPSSSADTEELVSEEQKIQYRALVASGGIQLAVKGLARKMASPCDADWIALKRLGRYLVGKPRVVTHFRYQHKLVGIHASVDSDWAGCVRTRRSTSGGYFD